MYFSRYCVRNLTETLEMKVIKAIRAYLKQKQFVAKLFLLNAFTCKQAVYEIYGTYNLYITSVQYSKNIQNSVVEKN